MFHPLCGYSLQKGAKYIAIADLVIVFISMTLRFIIFDYQEYQTHDYEIETEIYAANDTLPITNATDATAAAVSDLDAETHAAHVANITAQLVEILKQSGKSTQEQHEQYLAITIAIIVISGIIFLLYMGLEVWLCRLLLRASNNRDGSACKTWFWIRLCITLIVLLFSIVGIATLKYDWVDWVLEPLNLYRIYELIVVNEFKREIAATSGRVKLRA